MPVIALLLLMTAAPALAQAVTGTAWTRHAIDNSSSGADGVRLQDVNSDGLLDISTGWEEGGQVRVYLQPAVQQVRVPWPQVTVGAVESPEDAVFGDFDGDGAVDVLSSTEGEHRRLYIHWAPAEPAKYLHANAWQTAAFPQSWGRQWMFAAAAQIDGKEGLDFIAGGKGENAWLGWFQAPEAPRDLEAWIWHPLQRLAWVMTIRLVDMDGDGDLDVLYSERRGEASGVYWLEYPGAEHALGEWRRHSIGGIGREVMFLDAGVLETGGSMEIVAATRDGGVLRFSQAEGGAWRQRELPLPLETGTGKGVAVGDINGDGRGDIVVSCENAAGKHGVFWLSGAEPDWPAQAISGLEGTKFDRIELLDIDQDGDLDVITCEERENLGVIWFENPSLPRSSTQ